METTDNKNPSDKPQEQAGLAAPTGSASPRRIAVSVVMFKRMENGNNDLLNWVSFYDVKSENEATGAAAIASMKRNPGYSIVIISPIDVTQNA